MIGWLRFFDWRFNFMPESFMEGYIYAHEDLWQIGFLFINFFMFFFSIAIFTIDAEAAAWCMADNAGGMYWSVRDLMWQSKVRVWEDEQENGGDVALANDGFEELYF